MTNYPHPGIHADFISSRCGFLKSVYRSPPRSKALLTISQSSINFSDVKIHPS